MWQKKPKLGQHFLTSHKVAKQIVGAADMSPTSQGLEIGPGEGALTELLLETGASLTAVEKDRKLAEYLKKRFQEELESGQFRLVHGDILGFDPEILPEKYTLVGNIPYAITGAIIKKFLTAQSQPNAIVFLLQKEVAERIVAKSGKESILSLSVKAYGTPKIILRVPKKHFSPPPKVDSAVLKVTNISRDFFTQNTLDEKKFFELVKRGFAHKRKKLAKNLDISDEVLSVLGINPSIRAEDMTLQAWLSLIKTLKK